MRLSLFCWVGLALMMAGCSSQESASTGDDAKSADAECKTGECCSSVSRSSLMKKSSEKQEGARARARAKASDESK